MVGISRQSCLSSFADVRYYPHFKMGKEMGKARTRALNKLTDTTARTMRKSGRHADGGGLYLNVTQTGAKSWLFMWVKDGKRTELGLGSYPAVSLANARMQANRNRELLASGLNPKAERDREAVPTFAECADKFLASMKSEWRNQKHVDQWHMTLGDSYCSRIRPMCVSEIEVEDVLKVLSPVWTEKNETASRLRGRIERVLEYAKVKGWRTGENPAAWRGNLRNLLPKRQKLQRGHHAAMPYENVPAFFQSLADREAIAARGMEFLILTACRSGEVLEATWDEFDLKGGLWTIPPLRMKAGREHRVPLTPPALAIVSKLLKSRISAYVFPGYRKDKPLSNMAFAKLLERMESDRYTTHGFRSAFRDWAGDRTSFSREVAEQALAHAVGDATERAYRRADAIEKRRKLMEAWAKYLADHKDGKIIHFADRKA